jgi:predicted O-methyltransferase YrrM
MIRPQRLLRVAQRHVALGALARDRVHYIRDVACGLQRASEGYLAEEERELIARIEERRRRLEARTDDIAVVDYGAGSLSARGGAEPHATGRSVLRTIGPACRMVSKAQRWCLILFRLIRTLKPQICLELGTAFGISGAYQAAALALNGSGRLITLEGAVSLARIAEETFSVLALTPHVTVVGGRFQDTLVPTLESVTRVDYAFIDGHHEHAATLKYVADTTAALSHPGLLILDDIDWSDGMRRAWAEVESTAAMRVTVTLDGLGLCIVDPRIAKRRPLGISVV